MKSNYFLLAFIIMLVFLNCSKESSIDQEVIKEVKVTAAFSGMLPSSQVTTRVTDSNWEKGDAIGLFMINSGVPLDQNALESNVKYVTDGGHTFYNPSENKVYYPKNKQNVDFIAYYPYNISLSDLIYDVDISSQINLSDIDLLYSDNVKSVNSSSSSLNLQLTHQLVKVVINLNAGNTGIEIDNFSATITNVNRKASYLLSKGEISDKSDIGTVSFNVDSDNKTAQAILLPEEDLSDKELIIAIGDTSFSLSLENTTEDNRFNKSLKYSYPIVLRENEKSILDGVSATIEDWTTNETDTVYADEISSIDDNDSSTEDEDDDVKTYPNDGNGTKESPYNIVQALRLVKEKNDTKGHVYFKDVWVEGYIVGCVHPSNGFTSDKPNGKDLGNSFNLSLSDEPSVQSDENTLLVHLSDDYREDFNLINNYENLGSRVLLNGDIGNLNLIFFDARLAFINLKDVSFID